MSEMGLFRSKSVVCPVNQHCYEWARKYLGSCICSTRYGFSFALGWISVICWCVAEIPQIITNYKKKSTEGFSIGFLFAWIVGDIFNIVGCMLEPTTLPTQYYLAVLYVVTTLILAIQAVYYRYIYIRLKDNKRLQEAVQARTLDRREYNSDSDPDPEKLSNVERRGAAASSPIPTLKGYEELYFMSARSLSVSHTPTPGSYPNPRTYILDMEQRWSREPLLGDVRPSNSAPPRIKTMLCVVSLMTFLLSSSKHQIAERLENDAVSRTPTRGIVLQAGRMLLEAKNPAKEASAAGSSIGTILGWGMAAIYLGGRFPQIYLNIKRGHTEGLNPLMFVFAVIGNATYVASILVNSLHWSKVLPNLPWLVDAGGCALLDSFILLQFIYYRYRSRSAVGKYVC